MDDFLTRTLQWGILIPILGFYLIFYSQDIKDVQHEPLKQVVFKRVLAALGVVIIIIGFKILYS